MDEHTTRPRVYLIETMSDMEDDVLRTWLERQANDSGQPPPTVRVTDQALADLVRRKDDPLLTPLRVVWLPKETHPRTARNDSGRRCRCGIRCTPARTCSAG